MSDIFIDAEGHVIKNSMVDEHSIIKITEKVPDAKNIGKIICGETNSNILTFEMNRFYDNVDMVSKNIKFIIKTPSFGFDDYASNVQHNANLIRFSWVVPYSATQEAGNVNVAIEFFDDSYSLKTMPFVIKVDKSINSEETQLEVPTNWYIDIESRVLQLENKANENIADAVEDYMNEHPVQAVSDEHIEEVAIASFGNDDFNSAVDTQVNAYLAENDTIAKAAKVDEVTMPIYTEIIPCVKGSTYITKCKLYKNVEYIVERRTGNYTSDGSTVSALNAFIDGYAANNISLNSAGKYSFIPTVDGFLAFLTNGSTGSQEIPLSIRVYRASKEIDIVSQKENYPLVSVDNIVRGYYLSGTTSGIKENVNEVCAYITFPVKENVTYIIKNAAFAYYEVYEDGSFNYHKLNGDGTNTELEYTGGFAVKELKVDWFTHKNYHNGVAIKGYEDMSDDTTNVYQSENTSKFVKATNLMPMLYAHKVEAYESGRKLKQTIVDPWKYPLTPTWGNEYLAPWYEKLFNLEAITIDFEGDSITQGEDGGYREKCVEKIMTIGGYPSESLTIKNNGKGSRSTNEWIGTGEHYVYESDATDYPNGILDVGMGYNPDLIICAYGVNDANVSADTLSMQERVDLFEKNYREALDRIRGSVEVNGRPAYNRTAEDLGIILCMPTTVYESASYSTRWKQNWHVFVKEILQGLCREYKCAFADFSLFMYDHSWSTTWGSTTQTPPELHPNKSYSLAYNSILQPLIYPIGLWNK